MSKLLCKVAEVFQLKDRLVVVSDVLFEDFDREYCSGALVELRRPDGSVINTRTWPEVFSPTSFGRPAAFSVEHSLTKADIPPGTEIWLLQEQSVQQAQVEAIERRRSTLDKLG